MDCLSKVPEWRWGLNVATEPTGTKKHDCFARSNAEQLGQRRLTQMIEILQLDKF